MRTNPTFLAFSTWLLVAVSIAASGCSNGPRRAPVFPVTGRITHLGKPAPGAILIFHPDGDSTGSDMKARGKADESGVFQLTTYEKGDGAPQGDYIVTLYWPVPLKPGAPDLDDGPDRLKGRYLDIVSPLTKITIRPEPNTLDEIRVP